MTNLTFMIPFIVRFGSCNPDYGCRTVTVTEQLSWPVTLMNTDQIVIMLEFAGLTIPVANTLSLNMPQSGENNRLLRYLSQGEAGSGFKNFASQEKTGWPPLFFL